LATDETGAPAPSFIRFGTVLAGAQPYVFNNNVNPVFRGQVTLSSGAVVTAFIKDLDRDSLRTSCSLRSWGCGLGCRFLCRS
jgi:hypothetical protein